MLAFFLRFPLFKLAIQVVPSKSHLGLPYTRDGVVVQDTIAAHKCHRIDQALCDEHTIKRVTMVKWQSGYIDNVAKRNIEQAKAIESEIARNKIL
jgi:hypothetical protein